MLPDSTPRRPARPTPVRPTLAPQRVRLHAQSIAAPPDRVFPLLCPVREHDWLPGWRARMIHSASGIAEAGAVFASPHAGGESLWHICEYVPPRRIGFVRFQPDGLLVEIRIAIAAAAGAASRVTIRYAFTAVDARGEIALESCTDAAWQAMMEEWESRMNEWFAAAQ
jgi:hypothetical protein